MEIKKILASDKCSNLSAETSKETTDGLRRASEIKTGIGGVRDVFETAKEAPYQTKAAPQSVIQKSQTFIEQLVKNAATGILEAARLNTPANEAAIHNGVAEAQLAVSGIVSGMPSVGPIVSAVLAAIAAMIQADGSQNKATAATEQRATRWTALKKDHDDLE